MAYRLDGRQKKLSIGTYPAIDLRAARVKPTRPYGMKPVSLPMFPFHGHLPVVYVDGDWLMMKYGGME